MYRIIIGIRTVFIIIAFIFSAGQLFASGNGLYFKSLITGESGSDYFGTTVSAIGDLNGDEINDIVIGANGAGEEKRGRVYVFWGRKFSPRINAEKADVIIEGTSPNDHFGWHVALSGDINDDGYTDLAVSAINNETKAAGGGAVYIFLGPLKKGFIKSSEADWILFGVSTKASFGWKISTEGDINGDGKKDLAISAPFFSEKGEQKGRVYIFTKKKYSEESTADDFDIVIDGEYIFDVFGYSLSTAGDFNGDGIDDIAVGAYNSGSDGIGAGRAFLFFGGKALKGEYNGGRADILITGVGTQSWLGNAIVLTPDLNGDGCSELAVAASGTRVDGPETGRVYIFFGYSSDERKKIAASASDITLTGSRTGGRFGEFVNWFRDIDGDNRPDIVVSEPGGKYLKDRDVGRVFIFMGKSLLQKKSMTNPYTIETPEEKSRFGNALSIGDIDGDGIDELIVGARYASMENYNDGTVTIFGWQQSE